MTVSVKSIILKYCPAFLKSIFDRIENSPIGYRLAKGGCWSMVGVVMSRGLMLLAMVFVARILGKTAFGELGMIQTTVVMFGTFAGFGLGLTTTKYVAEFRHSNPERAGRIIGLSTLVAIVTGGFMALVLFIFAPCLAEHTINAPHLTGVLRISAVLLFLSALIGAQTGVLSGFEAFKTIAYVNLFVAPVIFPILIVGPYFGGLTGVVWALTISLGITCLFNHLALHIEAKRNNIHFTIRNCSRELPILWKFSFPAVLSSAMLGPVNWVCSALLVNQPNGYSEMGIFNAANQWRAMIIFIPATLGQVILPMLSNLNGLNEQSNYFKVIKITVLINIGVSLMAAIPVALAAPWIMDSYGPGFKAGSWVLVCLAFNTILIAFNSILGHALISSGKIWMGLWFNLLWAIVLIILSYGGTRLGYGALGLALANLGAYLLHSLWQSAYAFRTIRSEYKQHTST